MEPYALRTALGYFPGLETISFRGLCTLCVAIHLTFVVRRDSESVGVDIELSLENARDVP